MHSNGLTNKRLKKVEKENSSIKNANQEGLSDNDLTNEKLLSRGNRYDPYSDDDDQVLPTYTTPG